MMKYIFIIILFVSSATAEIIQTNIISLDGYAAKVNNIVITRSDVRKEMSPFLPQLYKTYSDDDLNKNINLLFLKTLNTLIENELIIAEFNKKGGEIPDRYVDESINKIINNEFNSSRILFEESLKKEKQTYDSFFKETKKRITLSMLKSQEIDQKIIVSPKEINDLYQKNIDKYEIPEKYRYSIISISTNKFNSATNALTRLNNNENFASIAEELSEDSYAKNGGAYPWIKQKDIPSIILVELKKLEINQISPLVKLDENYIIIKLNNHKKSSYKSFDEVKDILKKQLIANKSSELYYSWISRLKKQNYIKIYN